MWSIDKFCKSYNFVNIVYLRTHLTLHAVLSRPAAIPSAPAIMTCNTHNYWIFSRFFGRPVSTLPHALPAVLFLSNTGTELASHSRLLASGHKRTVGLSQRQQDLLFYDWINSYHFNNLLTKSDSTYGCYSNKCKITTHKTYTTNTEE